MEKVDEAVVLYEKAGCNLSHPFMAK